MAYDLDIPDIFKENIPAYYQLGSSVDRRLLDDVDLAGKKILNVGCGQYIFDDVYFAMRGAVMTGVDYEQEYVNRANARLRRAAEQGVLGDTAIEVRLGDGRALDFEDDTFDIVTSFSAIEHMPGEADRYEAVAEMARVVRPGGMVVVTGPNLLNLPATLVSRRVFSSRKNKFEHRYTPRELARMMTTAGLVIDRFDSQSAEEVDESLIKYKFPFLAGVPSVLLAPVNLVLRLLNTVSFLKYFGMRIGYRAVKRIA